MSDLTINLIKINLGINKYSIEALSILITLPPFLFKNHFHLPNNISPLPKKEGRKPELSNRCADKPAGNSIEK